MFGVWLISGGSIRLWQRGIWNGGFCFSSTSGGSIGCGSEGSGTEVSVSVPHPAEVLECPAEGSGADWTISVLSEFEIVLAAALTTAPVQRIGFLNVLMPVVSHFSRHSRSIYFLGFIFFSSLWTSLVPSGRTVTSGLAWALVPRLPWVTFLA